jgi:hypothetical protein
MTDGAAPAGGVLLAAVLGAGGGELVAAGGAGGDPHAAEQVQAGALWGAGRDCGGGFR